MGLLDDLGDLAKQFTAGNAPAADLHRAYDQVSATSRRRRPLTSAGSSRGSIAR